MAVLNSTKHINENIFQQNILIIGVISFGILLGSIAGIVTRTHQLLEPVKNKYSLKESRSKQEQGVLYGHEQDTDLCELSNTIEELFESQLLTAELSKETKNKLRDCGSNNQCKRNVLRKVANCL
ncbi:hypothetical protein [Thalassomonas sp. RHCl1]|uniref:hypothetical protein n=1 Tax=Thalassomonas sp. RHCl1 TaxID=2995320 RepID=UPI00248D174E|nr:hypothetical protein [Thalassomonas sp. RHCl1]